MARSNRQRVRFPKRVSIDARELDDLKGQTAAASRSQAIIEFTLDGSILSVNENFLKAMEYCREELTGRHHSMFVEPSYRDSAEYRAFWEKLGSGEFDAGQHKRLVEGGREATAERAGRVGPHGQPFRWQLHICLPGSALPGLLRPLGHRSLCQKEDARHGHCVLERCAHDLDRINDPGFE